MTINMNSLSLLKDAMHIGLLTFSINQQELYTHQSQELNLLQVLLEVSNHFIVEWNYWELNFTYQTPGFLRLMSPYKFKWYNKYKITKSP